MTTKQQRGGGRSTSKRRATAKKKTAKRPARVATARVPTPETSIASSVAKRAPSRVENILARAARRVVKTGRTVKRSAENALRGTRRRVGRHT